MKAKVNTNKMKEYSFLMIHTGIEFTYCRDDDVLVVLIGCLKDWQSGEMTSLSFIHLKHHIQ